MTTSYYVQSEFQFNTINGGAINNSIGSGAYFNNDQHLVFNASKECVIKSAIIYAESSNTILFELRNSNGVVIDDTIH